MISVKTPVIHGFDVIQSGDTVVSIGLLFGNDDTPYWGYYMSNFPDKTNFEFRIDNPNYVGYKIDMYEDDLHFCGHGSTPLTDTLILGLTETISSIQKK